jgi:hypothetical protein
MAERSDRPVPAPCPFDSPPHRDAEACDQLLSSAFGASENGNVIVGLG